MFIIKVYGMKGKESKRKSSIVTKDAKRHSLINGFVIENQKRSALSLNFYEYLNSTG